VSGKLSQTTQTLHIARATARTFERTQWEALEQRLLAWKSGLASVLDVVTSAQKTSGGNKAVAAASETVSAPQTAAVGA
jgi:translation initiation factor 3 subunit M